MNIPCLGESIEEILEAAFAAEAADNTRELELRPAMDKPIRLNQEGKWQEHVWEDQIPFWYDEISDSAVGAMLTKGQLGILLVPTWSTRRFGCEEVEIHRSTGRYLKCG